MSLLFPPRCVLCGKMLSHKDQLLCDDCRALVPLLPPPEDKLPYLSGYTAVWHYDGPVRGAILGFKFQDKKHRAKPFGKLLAMKLMEEYPLGFDALTWVPVSPIRRLSRGYDQGQLLARSVGKALGMKPRRLLHKCRHNSAQSGIHDAHRRKANVQGVYRMVSGGNVAGKRILLVDDVLTTGATAGECARTLLCAGAKEVVCGAVALAKPEKR